MVAGGAGGSCGYGGVRSLEKPMFHNTKRYKKEEEVKKKMCILNVGHGCCWWRGCQWLQPDLNCSMGKAATPPRRSHV